MHGCDGISGFCIFDMVSKGVELTLMLEFTQELHVAKGNIFRNVK